MKSDVSSIAVAARRLPGLSGRKGQLVGAVAACVLGGVAVLYAVAIPLGAAIGDVPIGTFAKGAWVFVPGDLLKATVASVVATAAFRAAPALRPRPARRC